MKHADEIQKLQHESEILKIRHEATVHDLKEKFKTDLLNTKKVNG